MFVRVSTGGRGLTDRQQPTKTARVAVTITFSEGGTVTPSGRTDQASRAAWAQGTGSLELLARASELMPVQEFLQLSTSEGMAQQAVPGTQVSCTGKAP